MRVQLIQEPFSQRFAVFPRELEWKAGNGYREVGKKTAKTFFFFLEKICLLPRSWRESTWREYGPPSSTGKKRFLSQQQAFLFN